MYKGQCSLFQEEIMKAKKKLIGILLVIVVIVLSLGVLTACGETPGETSKNKKAVVICTALLSGGLYDTKTNEAIWDPVAEGVYFQQAFPGGDMMGLVMAVLTDKTTYDLIDGIMKYKDESVENLLWQITLDEQGKSNNPNLRPANVRPTTADGTFKSTLYNDSGEVVDGYGAYTAGEKIQYGAIAAYRQQCLDLQARYEKQGWDVVVFNYDWRIDNRINSELLEQFIQTNGWEEVILTSHSMGGPVVAGYIARLQNKWLDAEAKNPGQTDVKKPNQIIRSYRAFSPATAGSLDAIYYLDDPIGAVADVVNGTVGDTLGGVVLGVDAISEGIKKLAGPLAQNLTSVMQLLPFQTFADSDYYGENESPVYVDGVPVKNMYEWYCSRPWAHTSDWKPGVDGIYDKLKPGMKTLPEYWDSFYVKESVNDKDANVYAPELVNTTYCLGVGYNTKKSVQIVTKDTDTVKVNKVTYEMWDTRNHKYDTPLTSIEYYSYDHKAILFGDGDGTMPTNACLGGLNYNGDKTISNTKGSRAIYPLPEARQTTTICYYNTDHGTVGGYWDVLKWDFYEMIDKIIVEDEINPFF